MSNREFVAVTVSGKSAHHDGLCVENVYLLEVVGAHDALASARRIVESRIGAIGTGREIEYEIVTEIPEICERTDVTWLTPRPARNARGQDRRAPRHDERRERDRAHRPVAAYR